MKKEIILALVGLAVIAYIFWNKNQNVSANANAPQISPKNPPLINPKTGEITGGQIKTPQMQPQIVYSNNKAFEAKKIHDLKKQTFVSEEVRQLKQIMNKNGLYTEKNPNFAMNNHAESEFLELFMTFFDKTFSVKRPNAFKNALKISAIALAAIAATVATVLTAGAATPTLVIVLSAAVPALGGARATIDNAGTESKKNIAYTDAIEALSIPSNFSKLFPN